MVLTVTLTIAAACAAVNLWLGLRVVRGRFATRTMQGDGDGALTATMRAHANFTEYAPFVLVLIAALELSGASTTWLWIAGAAFVAARIAHGLGMTRPAPNPLRAGGIVLTWGILALLAGWALALVYAESQVIHIDARSYEADDTPRG